jgi:chaperonin GroES
MKLQPLSDKVIVEVLSSEEKTSAGLYLPDTAKEKPQEAKVIAIGKGKTLSNGKLVPPQVKVGDKVVFAKYSGSEVKIEEKEYLIIDQDDLLAVLD